MSTNDPSDAPNAAMRQAFDVLTSMNGLTLPAERVETIFKGFLGLQGMTAELRRPRTAASEPAGIFVADTITRGTGS